MRTSKKQDVVQQPTAAPEQPAGNMNEGAIWPQRPQGSFSAQQGNPAGSVQQRNPGGQEGVHNGEPKDTKRQSKKTDSEGVPYKGQKLKRKEFVNPQGFVVKKKKTGKRKLMEHIAAHLAVCLCCAYVCTAPCCCGL